MDREAELLVYMEATDKELAVCPHCETWLASECLAGLGCPTRDGLNGSILRAHAATSEGSAS